MVSHRLDEVRLSMREVELIYRDRLSDTMDTATILKLMSYHSSGLLVGWLISLWLDGLSML